MRIRVAILVCIIALSLQGIAQNNIVSNKKDSVIYETCIKALRSNNNPSITDIAKQFRGKPYVASTLDKADTESLTINLNEFDCTTFVESCMAINEVLTSGDTSFSNYCAQLQKIRYRNGQIDGYPSRLHYVTDWIYENEKNNILENITLKLGGKTVDKQIDYMSVHPDLYKHLKGDKANIDSIKAIEKRMNARKSYQVIPVADIAQIANKIQNGDIIVFATNIVGLDYSHIGIAFHNSNGQLTFIHASTRTKNVTIENKSLIQYCRNSKICSGITVLRLKNN